MPRRSIRNTRLVPDRAASSRIGLHSVSPCCAPQVTRAALSRCRRGFQLGARRAPRRPTLLRCSPSRSRKGGTLSRSALTAPTSPSTLLSPTAPPPVATWQKVWSVGSCGPSEVWSPPSAFRLTLLSLSLASRRSAALLARSASPASWPPRPWPRPDPVARHLPARTAPLLPPTHPTSSSLSDQQQPSHTEFFLIHPPTRQLV